MQILTNQYLRCSIPIWKNGNVDRSLFFKIYLRWIVFSANPQIFTSFTFPPVLMTDIFKDEVDRSFEHELNTN